MNFVMWKQGLIREFVEALVPNKNTVKNKCERCQELLRYNERNHEFINTLLIFSCGEEP